MTSGKILKPLILFAIPCIISNILQNLYNLVDTAIVGQLLGLNPLAAVGATGSVVSLCITTITGLMSGFSIVAGIRFGAKKYSEIKSVFVNALFIVAAVCVSLTLFGTLFARRILELMNTSPELIDDATIYLTMMFAGISTTVLYNFFCEMLRAIGNSKLPLVFLIIASVIHIGLNYLFMLVFKLHVAGAALSTALSQGMATLMCFVYLYRATPYFKVKRKDFRFEKSVARECLKVGVPMAGVNFVVNFGVLILQFVTNGIGTEYVAAYSGASKIGYIYTAPIFGFASALAVFASQNFGAGNMPRIKSGIKRTLAVLFGINTVILAFSCVFSKYILRFVVGDNQTAVESGTLYLTVRLLSAYALIPAACIKNILPAMGRTLSPSVSSFIEIAIRFVSPILLVANLGFVGVPLTDGLTWAALAIFFIAVYPYEMRKISDAMYGNKN